ncbi:MAG TPA: 4Fe-4S dicluster domain-containing protein [Desulfosporosinus sp.]|nr:4Fe-4S dicluster domain-containing protein [Desulfosporosinus sp.]
MIAQIGIDYTLCKDPLVCRQCLSVCPSVVFVCGPTKKWKGRETETSEYRIVGRYFDKCSGCGDCVKVCPTDAIHIEFVPSEQLAHKYREEREIQLKERNS